MRSLLVQLSLSKMLLGILPYIRRGEIPYLSECTSMDFSGIQSETQNFIWGLSQK
jgi:hypothetical protein